jgi:hypothetical protein
MSWTMSVPIAIWLEAVLVDLGAHVVCAGGVIPMDNALTYKEPVDPASNVCLVGWWATCTQ